MLGNAEAVNTARQKRLIDLPKPRATAESNSSDRTSSHHILLCFEQLSTLFSLSHFFFFPNTFFCQLLACFSKHFQNLVNMLTLSFPCSHFLFHKTSQYVLTFLFSNHSLSFLSSSLFPHFLHFTLLFTIPLLQISILQSSISSSMSFYYLSP